jgi:hypothetical protein
MNRKIGSVTTKAYQRGASVQSKSDLANALANSCFVDSTDVSAVEVQDELEEEKGGCPEAGADEEVEGA